MHHGVVRSYAFFLIPKRFTMHVYQLLFFHAVGTVAACGGADDDGAAAGLGFPAADEFPPCLRLSASTAFILAFNDLCLFFLPAPLRGPTTFGN
jgi:hypothetical protein